VGAVAGAGVVVLPAGAGVVATGAAAGGLADAAAEADADAAGVALCVETLADAAGAAVVPVETEELPALTPTEPVAPAF
jgi:hypothetical protein